MDRKDSNFSISAWADDFKDQLPPYERALHHSNNAGSFRATQWRHDGSTHGFNLAPGSGPYRVPSAHAPHSQLRVPSFQRQLSYGATPSSVPDDGGFDDGESLADDATQSHRYVNGSTEKRTLYLSGFTERTTYQDLVSTIKGGKLLSINLRSERSATVTFLDGAADFLNWAKRNDVYLHSKRIEVKWADRQFRLNNHISNKIANGASRNLLVRGAFANGLTEPQIRLDMEHIHNLVIIAITFRQGDAYVSTNSVHNALFARTCMMSRTAYKGCKIEFYRDECDVPLPQRSFVAKVPAQKPVGLKRPLTNRFDMLNIDGSEDASDEENRMPAARTSDEDDTLDLNSNVGVSLNFLDSESA